VHQFIDERCNPFLSDTTLNRCPPQLKSNSMGDTGCTADYEANRRSSEEQIAHLQGAHKIDVAATVSDVASGIVPGPSPDVYAFYRGRTQRNLYRIPIR
jgi:hypothetical protein